MVWDFKVLKFPKPTVNNLSKKQQGTMNFSEISLFFKFGYSLVNKDQMVYTFR